MERKTLRISVVGADKSGKTAITVRFLTGKFIYDYLSGYNVVYRHNFLMESTAIPLEIVDTSGDESISDAIKESNGIVIVYAIDCAKSFERAKEILANAIDNSIEKDLPYIALVGNKTDLWKYKTVERDVGKGLAEQYTCEYFELSALSCKDSVNNMFNSVIQISLGKSKPRACSLPTSTTISQYKSDNNKGFIPQLQRKDRRRSTSLINIVPIEEEEGFSSQTLSKNCSSICLMTSIERSELMTKITHLEEIPDVPSNTKERSTSVVVGPPSIEVLKPSESEPTLLACDTPKKSNNTKEMPPKKMLVSSSSSGEIGIREQNKNNVSKIVRRTLTEMSITDKKYLDNKHGSSQSLSKVIETKANEIKPRKTSSNENEKKTIENNKAGILHKTLGEVGFLAFSTLHVPVSSKKERPKSPFSKRRLNSFIPPMPLLVGKSK